MSKKNSKKINAKKEKQESKEKEIKKLKEEKIEKRKENEEGKEKEGDDKERKELQLPKEELKEEFDFQLEIVTAPARAPVLKTTQATTATTTTARLEDSLEEVSVSEREERGKKKEEKPYIPVHYSGSEIRYIKKTEEDFEEKQTREFRKSVIRLIQREWRDIREKELQIEPIQEARFEEIIKYEKKYEKPHAREDGTGIEELKRRKDKIKEYCEMIR